MKTKLVLWGTNAANERVLVALELLPQENVVKAYTFPEAIATEEFGQRMMDEWREGKPVEFPEGFAVEEKELTLSESILPQGVKPERDDIIQRAQTEWHFVVLSSKLHAAYLSELQEIKERVARLPRFDSAVWDELKSFWAKVQDQVRDKNLFREHGDTLRDFTNELFSDLKALRNKLDQEFDQLSKENFERFQQTLTEIERKVNSGARLQPLFDELKELQRKFRDTRFTKEHRNKVWDALDGLFKTVKEKRFGASAPAAEDNSAGERLTRRYEGLLAAIDKMEKSIQRDADDLDFQKRKVEVSDGQLEAQLRQAKILMVEERIRSKQDKLEEMLHTKVELEKRMNQQKERDARKEEKDKLEETKKAIQDKIASEIKAAADARVDDSDKLEKMASELSKGKPGSKKDSGESLFDAVTASLTDSFEDMVDTVKAAAEVVGDKIQEKVAEVSQEIAESLRPSAQEETAETPVSPAPDTPAGSDESPNASAPEPAPQEGAADEDIQA